MLADQPRAPITGVRAFSVLRLSQAEYLTLVDRTGREIRADKRGAIDGPPSVTLSTLGFRSSRWTQQVMAVKSDFNRAMGSVESMVEKATEIGQRWLKGLPSARRMAKA